jgi:hypothetical protein
MMENRGNLKKIREISKTAVDTATGIQRKSVETQENLRRKSIFHQFPSFSSRKSQLSLRKLSAFQKTFKVHRSFSAFPQISLEVFSYTSKLFPCNYPINY